jgi:hypothetical protein
MLAMLLATAFVLHRVLTFDAPKPARRKIGWAITFALITVSALHCYIMSLGFHSAVFAAMVAVVGYKTRGLIQKIKDSRQRSNAKRLSKIGSGQCKIHKIPFESPRWSLVCPPFIPSLLHVIS